MGTVREAILGHLEKMDEYVVAFVIGPTEGSMQRIPPAKLGKPLTQEDIDLLNYEMDEYANPVYVWTNKCVMFLVNRDGVLVLSSIPISPTECLPEIGGQMELHRVHS